MLAMTSILSAKPEISDNGDGTFTINQDYYNEIKTKEDTQRIMIENLHGQLTVLDQVNIKLKKENNQRKALLVSNNIMITVSITAVSVAIIEGIILAVK